MTNEEILEAIGNLTVLELSELVKAAEEKFGCWCNCRAEVIFASSI